MVSRMGILRVLLLGFGLGCMGCSGGQCEEIATLLRECCAKGPAELRVSCENEAQHLQNDGNADACQSALDAGVYARCAQ
jgi:hypothetical protein